MWTLLALAACHKPPKVPTEPLAPDAARAAAEALRAEAAGPVAAKFSIRLETRDGTVNASGALLVRPPDAFRVELSGPIGPPQLVVASDGHAVNAWLAGKTTYYQGDDAVGALRGLTGVSGGTELVTAILLGQLAVPAGADLRETGPVAYPGEGDAPPRSGPEWRWTWCSPTDACVTEGVAQPTGRLTSVVARAGLLPIPLLQADVLPGAGGPYPTGLDVTLPPIGAHAVVEFHSWAAATPPEAAFHLAPPPGATIIPLAVGTAGTAPAPSSTP